MKEFWLTQGELQTLHDTHKAESRRRAAYKINTAILLGTGRMLKAAKEALLLDEGALRFYTEKYQLGGVKNASEN